MPGPPLDIRFWLVPSAAVVIVRHQLCTSRRAVSRIDPQPAKCRTIEKLQVAVRFPAFAGSGTEPAAGNSTGPAPREYHTLTALADGRLLLFGGETSRLHCHLRLPVRQRLLASHPCAGLGGPPPPGCISLIGLCRLEMLP